jgi:hypothetical protein
MFKNQLRRLPRFGGQITPFYFKQHTAKHLNRRRRLVYAKINHKKGDKNEYL